MAEAALVISSSTWPFRGGERIRTQPNTSCHTRTGLRDPRLIDSGALSLAGRLDATSKPGTGIVDCLRGARPGARRPGPARDLGGYSAQHGSGSASPGARGGDEPMVMSCPYARVYPLSNYPGT